MTANGKAVALEYETDLDCQDIKTSTLVGPGCAVLTTGAGVFSYDTKTGKQVAGYTSSGGGTLAATPDGKFFATASAGLPVITVYRPTSSDPVLTVYAVGGEWVAWTPGGAWASSVGAEKWAGSLTDPGPGKLPVFVPFDPKLRDPDKVKAALK